MSSTLVATRRRIPTHHTNQFESTETTTELKHKPAETKHIRNLTWTTNKNEVRDSYNMVDIFDDLILWRSDIESLLPDALLFFLLALKKYGPNN